MEVELETQVHSRGPGKEVAHKGNRCQGRVLGLLSTPGAVQVGERGTTVGATQMTIPPSTCSTAPVVNELASEAK